MDLIMRCLSNNSQQRPRAAEIVGRMVGVVLEHPPSFENRVEMLQRVSALLTENRELVEVVRKNSAIQEKEGEIKELAEDKRKKVKALSSVCMQLVHLVEADQIKWRMNILKVNSKGMRQLLINMK